MNARRILALTLVRTAVLAVALAVAACSAPRRPAPVIDRTASARPLPDMPPAAVQPAPPQLSDTYTVKRGDTLYSIALDHGLDYRELAEANGIVNPALIREGQVLRTRPGTKPPGAVQVNPIASAGAVQTRPLSAGEAARAAPKPAQPALKTEPRAVRLPYSEENLALLTRQPAKPEPRAQTASAPQSSLPPQAKPEPQAALKTDPKQPAPAPAEPDADSVDWSWPAAGRLLARFSEPANKGVDIGGRKGEPVLASAGGRVVYSGEGLRGYGKLIIIKHNNTYLSAYAHNDNILVKEGQSVVKGQKIGEIGSTGTDQPKLHFEIRRMGKPVDPLRYLPERPS